MHQLTGLALVTALMLCSQGEGYGPASNVRVTAGMTLYKWVKHVGYRSIYSLQDAQWPPPSWYGALIPLPSFVSAVGMFSDVCEAALCDCMCAHVCIHSVTNYYRMLGVSCLLTLRFLGQAVIDR